MWLKGWRRKFHALINHSHHGWGFEHCDAVDLSAIKAGNDWQCCRNNLRCFFNDACYWFESRRSACENCFILVFPFEVASVVKLINNHNFAVHSTLMAFHHRKDFAMIEIYGCKFLKGFYVSNYRVKGCRKTPWQLFTRNLLPSHFSSICKKENAFRQKLFLCRKIFDGWLATTETELRVKALTCRVTRWHVIFNFRTENSSTQNFPQS